jgi:hypothetical protein
VWAYRERYSPECGVFDLAMREGSLRTFKTLSARYDSGKFARIADIGDGDGSFLASVLKTHRVCVGVLFDQPHVIAAASGVLLDAGVADRYEVVGGSFRSLQGDGLLDLTRLLQNTDRTLEPR